MDSRFKAGDTVKILTEGCCSDELEDLHGEIGMIVRVTQVREKVFGKLRYRYVVSVPGLRMATIAGKYLELRANLIIYKETHGGQA